MPQQIEIPGQGILEFPDEFSDDQIRDVIKRKFPQPSPALQPPVDLPQAGLLPATRPINVAPPLAPSISLAAEEKRAPAPAPPPVKSILPDTLRELVDVDILPMSTPEQLSHATEMTERQKKIVDEIGQEAYEQRLKDITTRFDTAIAQVQGEGDEQAQRRQRLWDMRTAALNEMGVETLGPMHLPALTKEGAQTIVGAGHPRLANILSTGQQVVSGTAEGFAQGAGPFMFSRGAGHVVGRAMLGEMLAGIPKNLYGAAKAYIEGDVEAGDRALVEVGGTAALLGIPAAASKLEALRQDAINTRSKVVDPRAQAWAHSFGAGGEPAETAMVRTSQRVLEPHKPETVLLSEIRPEPGPLGVIPEGGTLPVPPPAEPSEPIEPGAPKEGYIPSIFPAPEIFKHVEGDSPARTEAKDRSNRWRGDIDKAIAEEEEGLRQSLKQFPGERPWPQATIDIANRVLVELRKLKAEQEKGKPDDTTGIGREQQHRGTAPRETVQTDVTQVREEGGPPAGDSGGAERGAAEQAQAAPPAEPVEPPNLPKIPSGNIAIALQHPDGTTETALFAGYLDQPDFPPAHKKMQVAYLKNGSWSHGLLHPGDTVLSEVPTFDEWKAQQPTKPPLPEVAPQPTVPTAPEPAATITGPDVQKGTEMPAEAGAVTPPTPTAPAADPTVDLPSLIDKAMAIVRTKQLDPQERSALAQHMETARKGDPAPLIDLTEKLSKNPDKPRKQRVARGVPGMSRFDRETQLNGPDILSWMVNNIKLLSRSAARKIWGKEKYEQNKSLWDDAPTELPGGVHHNVIYSEKGLPPDRVAQRAYAEGVLKEGDTEKELWPAIRAASAERAKVIARTKREEKWMAEDAKAQEDWEKATKKQSKDDIEVTAEDLSVGDLLEVDGERVEVTGRDEEGTLTLKDGRKFGTQTLPEGKKIYVEKFEQQPVEGEAEFLPPEETETGGFPKHPDLPKSAKPGSDIFSDYHEAVTEWENKVREWLNGKPENKAIIWEQDNGNVYTVTRNVGEKPWRVTSFVPNKEGNALLPYGHREYSTRESAIFEEGQNAKVFHDEMPKPVLTEKEIYGWKEMADIPDKSKLVWYSLKGGSDARHDLSMRMRGTTYMREFVRDSITDDGRVAFTSEIPDKDLDYLGLSKTDKTTPPKLRTGEKAGELFQGEDQPFNLAGQQGIDAERLAKEKAEADRKAAEKKAFDEAHAQDLPKNDVVPKPEQLSQLQLGRAPNGGTPHPDPERAKWGQLADNDPGVVEATLNLAEANPQAKKLFDAVANGGRIVRRGPKIFVLDNRGQAVGHIDPATGGLNVFEDVPLNRIEMGETLERGMPQDMSKVDRYAEMTTKAPVISAHGPRYEGDSYQIINGHHRFLAAQKRGDPTIRVDASVVDRGGSWLHVAVAGQESGIPDFEARFRAATEEYKRRLKPDETPAAKPDVVPSVPEGTGIAEGKAPDGTRVRNFVKEDGRWWSFKPDGTRNKLPANRPTSRKLEAEAALPPAPPETRTIIQIVNQAKQIRVKLPEGATVVRGYDSKGRKSDIFIADVNRGDNPFHNGDIVRLEAGIKDKKGDFKKVEGNIEVTEYKQGAIDKAISALNAAKIKKTKGPQSGDVPIQVITGVTWGDFQRIWNAAMDIGIAALKAGKTIQEAIEAAIDHLRSAAISYGSSFDENMARARLKQVMEPGPTGTMVRTPEELAKQKAFGVKPGVRTVGAYSDIARLKDQEAQTLNLSPRARRLLSLPNQMELAARGLTESAGIENYKEASAAVENATPDVKWGVVRDGLHSMGFEQRRSMKLKELYEKQRAIVSSPGFQNKMIRLAQREWEAETRTQKEQTFKNVLAVKAAEYLSKLEQKKVEDAESEMLRQDLKQARQLQDYALAVGMEMDNIVSVVYPNYWEFGRANKNGKDFTDIYLAVKAGQGEPVTDPQRLALVRLAAEVLAINDNMTTRLVWLEQMRQEPDFAKAVNDFGKAFAKRMEQDPTRAIKELVEKQAGLSRRAAQARQAFKDLNRQMMRDVEKYSDLESAWQVDERVKASDEWKDLVNQMYSDAKALRIPDEILLQQKNGDVYNEFTGRFKKLDPFGAMHEVDLNWTRDSVAKAQEKIEGYLNRIRDWLNDPATVNSPDRPYWQDQHDFVDAVYNTASVYNPSNVKSLVFRHSWTMPEFFYRQAELPAAKVSQTAFENWHRAWLQGTQWSQATEQPLIHSLQRAARKHGFNPALGLQEYREQILNPLAWEYRDGRAVKAGEMLMGYRIEPEDIAAMKHMGSAISEIFNKQKNIGAERVMTPGWLYDEWAKGVFAIRRPAEFAAATGMTLPHEFSQAARTLASRVGEEIGVTDYAKLTDLFNGDLYFEPFVMRWLAQRSPDFTTPTPFEPLFKEIVAKWNAKEADAPRTVEEIVDFIDQNTDDSYDAEGITAAIVGSMARELESFYKRFVKKDPNDFSDIRVVRATKEGPFTTGFQKDVGSSFYYDFGMINAQEVRSLAIDSGMYHMMRFANSLASLEQEYGRALRDLAETKGRPELRRKLMESNRKLWRDGADFRDYDRLMAQLNEVKYFRTRLPIFSGRDVAVYEGLRNVYRLIGNSVLRTLSGWATMARVLTGSVAKQGFVFGAAERFYPLAYPKAAVSMVLSALRIGVGGPIMVAGRRLGFVDKFEGELSGLAEEIFRNGKYFNQQYDFGLGTKTPVLDTMYNDITMPYTHGRGYDPHLSENAGLRLVQKGGYRLLSLLETGLEPVRVIFPTLGYSIAYDSVARQMYWRIKAMESQARRTFDAHEKIGQLSKFDLDNPKSVKNVFLPEYVLPRGLLPKTATQLNLIREMFKRGTDIDLQDAVFTFWSRLAKATPEERKSIHLLSADASPADAARIERNRSGALASVGLFDIHHASPANRMWALRAGAVGRIMFPIAGWTVQSTRQWFAILGRASHDPKLRPAVLTAMTGVTVLAALGMLGLSGDLEKRAFEQLKWVLDKKVDPVRHFGQGRDAKENIQIAISDMTAYITTVANMFDAVLGEQSNRMSTIENVYPTEKIKSLLTYINGVVHTHDPTYGLASFASRELPIIRPIVNRLPGQEGIVAEQNIRTIIQRFAPPELLRQTTGSYGVATPTELSPIKQQLANAIYKKDWIGVIEAYDKFRAKAAELGRPDPDRLAANVMRSLNPYSMALVGHPTEAQRQAILERLPPDQRQMLLDAETGYMAAAQSVGVQSEMVRKEPGTPGERAPAAPGGGGRVSLPVGGGGAIRTPSVGTGRVSMGRRISLGRSGAGGGAGRVGTRRAAHYVSGKLKASGSRGRRLSYASLVGRGTSAGRKFSIRRPKASRVRRVRLYA